MGRCSCSAWKRCLVGRLCCRPSASTGGSNLPSTSSSSELAFKKEISIEDLEVLMEDVTKALERFQQAPSSESHLSLLQWSAYKERATSFMETVDGLPKDFTAKAKGQIKSLLPLLKEVCGGLGQLRWLAVGFSLVAWSLDTIDTVGQNRDDCFRLLSRTADLLKHTKTTWINTGIENFEDLQDCVVKAFHCAIICSSLFRGPKLSRFLNAATIQGSVASLSKDLDAQFQRIDRVALRDLHAERPRLYRQVTYALRDDTVGAGEEMPRAIKHLNSDSSELVAVCLHGMGGIGKSTIAQTIFVEFQRKQSYRCCRVELPFGIKAGEFPKIQKQILNKLCEHGTFDFADTMDGRHYLETELRKIKERVFLYLDNILEESHLPDLLPELSCFPDGSRILLTTRHKYVCKRIKNLKVELIEVKRLEERLANELLWRHVHQGQQEPPNVEGEHWKNIKDLETEVLSLCEGLPLALKVVGAYIGERLRGLDEGANEVKVWEEAIEAMKNAESLRGGGEDELYSRLYFSVAELDEQTRKAFVDVVVFASEETSWEEAQSMVTSRRLENLKERALLERRVSDIRKVEMVGVHDVLKHMGLKMAEADKQEFRVTSQDALKRIITSDFHKVVALSNVKVKAELLQQMPWLRLLVDVELSGECISSAEFKHERLTFVRITTATSRPFDMSACATLQLLSWTLWKVEDDFASEVADGSKLEVSRTLQLLTRLVGIS